MRKNFRQLASFFFRSEVARFLVVGSATVLVDLACYFLLINTGYDTSLSKGISFSVGTVFAYFSNSRYTFQKSRKGAFPFFAFCLLYLLTLLINIVTNELALDLMSRTYESLVLAFFVATTLSASLNFIGMKYYVFR